MHQRLTPAGRMKHPLTPVTMTANPAPMPFLRIVMAGVSLMLLTNLVVSRDVRLSGILQTVLRWAIVVTASYLIASRRRGWRNTLRSLSAAVLIMFIAVFLELSAYVLEGRAAAERRGPAIVLAMLLAAPVSGLIAGIVGASASEVRRRLRA
jgi:uncharacterized membrane protein